MRHTQTLEQHHPHPHLVLCQAKDEADLIRIGERLIANDARIRAWYEPDQGNELTAIASDIVWDRSPFKKLRLLDLSSKGPSATPQKEKPMSTQSIQESTTAQPSQVKPNAERPARASYQSTVNEHGITVYQSRWGWHPCSFEEFQQLKAMHKDVWELFYACYGRNGLDVTARQFNKWRNKGTTFGIRFPHFDRKKDAPGIGPVSDNFTKYSAYCSQTNVDAANVVIAFRHARAIFKDPNDIDESAVGHIRTVLDVKA